MIDDDDGYWCGCLVLFSLLVLTGTHQRDRALQVWQFQDVTWDLLVTHIRFTVWHVTLKHGVCVCVCVSILCSYIVSVLPPIILFFQLRRNCVLCFCVSYRNGIECEEHDRQKYCREFFRLLPITPAHLTLHLCSLLTSSPRCQPVWKVWENACWRGCQGLLERETGAGKREGRDTICASDPSTGEERAEGRTEDGLW